MIRTPIVNGQFYPDKKQELLREIDSYDPKNSQKLDAKGIIVPHAGYLYSGRVAATTISKIIAKKRILILGPNHTGLGTKFGLWSKGSWNTPLGTISIDEDLANSILEKSKNIKADHLSHEKEHSIEVQLPILQNFFGDFSFVPIACKNAELSKYRDIARELVEAIKPIRNDILIVASSDLTHYEPEQTARLKDRLAIEAMINIDEKQLLDEVYKNDISMCGVAPVSIALSCLKALGARKAQVALYETSARASGDTSAVVGYAGIIIS